MATTTAFRRLVRRLLPVGIAAACLSATALGPAQAADQSQTAQQKSEKVPGVNQDEPLAKQLNRNNGVITPPPTGDPGIETTVPNPDPGTTPVIPPAGTPGGNPNVQPK